MAYLRMKKRPPVANHQPQVAPPKKAKRQRPTKKADKLARWGVGEMQRLTSPISHGFGTRVRSQRHLREPNHKLKGHESPKAYGGLKFIPPKSG